MEYERAVKKLDISEETRYGVPMSIVIYKDKDGNTVPRDFLTTLNPQPKSVEIINSPYFEGQHTDKIIEKPKVLIPTTEIVTEYPAVENELPYDIVTQTVRFDESERELSLDQPEKGADYEFETVELSESELSSDDEAEDELDIE